MLDLHSMSADPNPKTILRIEEVLHRTGLKRTMLYDLVRKGMFPQQLSLGARAVGWYEEQVEIWIRNRHTAGTNKDGRLQDPKREAPELPLVCGHTSGANTSKAMEHAPDRRHAKASQTTVKASVESKETERANHDRAPKQLPPSSIEAEELRHPRDENVRLKRLIADLMLKNDLLQSATQGNALAS
jgi:prophage regulatory protein